MSALLASEGGWQDFTLKGGEWLILWLSGGSAILALLVGWYLMVKVLQEGDGTDKMKEIAQAIQVGAWAYLKRQFRTIGAILVPVGAVVFLTSVAIDKPNGESALSFVSSGLYRTISFVLGCVASGLTGYIGMTLATRGNVRTAAAARRGSMRESLQVAFRTGGVAGMFTVGLGLLGATLIIALFQNTSSAMLVGFGFGGSLLALFLRVGGGIFTKAADVGADLVGKVEAGIPEDDPRNPATIADNVGDNVGDCAGMAADLFESYEVTLVASIILGVAAFNSIGANPAKNYQGDGDSVHRLFYDTIKGGDFRAREGNVYRLAEVSVNIIDQMVAQGVPFAREYGGLLDNRSFGGAQVSRTFYARGQTGQQLLLGAYQQLARQIGLGNVRLFNRTELVDVVTVDGRCAGIVTRDLMT
ncbi:MAG: sodium/proton-translocating pyrophosphatase, partial [Actinomycetota bacterium]